MKKPKNLNLKFQKTFINSDMFIDRKLVKFLDQKTLNFLHSKILFKVWIPHHSVYEKLHCKILFDLIKKL